MSSAYVLLRPGCDTYKAALKATGQAGNSLEPAAKPVNLGVTLRTRGDSTASMCTDPAFLSSSTETRLFGQAPRCYVNLFGRWWVFVLPKG